MAFGYITQNENEEFAPRGSYLALKIESDLKKTHLDRFFKTRLVRLMDPTINFINSLKTERTIIAFFHSL